MSDLLKALKSGRVLLMDGAMGTELQRAGLRPPERAEEWNLARPARVRAIHDAYVTAGARVILTNSFQAHSAAVDGLALADVLDAAIDLAMAASAGQNRYVVADFGPIVADDGREFPKRDELCKVSLPALRNECAALLLETCSSSRARFGVRAFQQIGEPVLLSLTYRKTPRGYESLDRHSPHWFAERAEKWGAAALGVNCGVELDVSDCAAIARQYREATRLPLFARPNAGTPKRRGKRWVYPRTPEMMAAQLPELLEAGVAMVGGCCGTTPAHIAAFRPVVDRWNRRSARRS